MNLAWPVATPAFRKGSPRNRRGSDQNFTQLMMRHGAMCLALGLSFIAAFAQTPVVNQTTRAQLSSAESESRSVKEYKQDSKTEKEKQVAASLAEEMRRMRQLMEQMRGEWRRDFSDRPFFLTSAPGVRKRDQNTATLGLIWWFGKEGGW